MKRFTLRKSAKSTIKRHIIFILSTLLLLQSGCSAGSLETLFKKKAEESQLPSAQEYEASYRGDALALIAVVEDTHPAFDLDDVDDGYEQAKQDFIDSITEDTTEDEFVLLIQRYLATLRDAHTMVHRVYSSDFLDLNTLAVGDELILLDSDDNLTDTRITHIGGVPIETVFETVQEYFVAENDAARESNNSIWSLNREMLELAGCDINDKSANISINQNGEISVEEVEFRNVYLGGNTYTKEISSEMIGDIYYIDMNICNDNAKLDMEAKALKKAVKDGVTKVIIDVRDNPGGNSSACVKLIEAMGMRAPRFGAYIKYSALAHKHYKEFPSKGTETYKPKKSTAKRNDKINLVVLTNGNTFSSATMMATFVKDGSLGTVIGTPSKNAPSSYGDILYYELPFSGIDVSISFKRFLRPDTETDQRILMPDIVTEHNEDILETAINYLS
jgi:hypothetical protein